MVKPIQELIDEAIVPEPRKRSGKFSPSSFGRCFRAQYWNRKDEPKTNLPDKRTRRVFKCGNLFEEFVGNLITKTNNCLTQQKVECEDVIGFVDFVKGNEVIDIKSQHSKAFWYFNKYKPGKDVIKDKFPNWMQVMYYVRELKKDFGRLVFISKDDLCIKEFVQPLNDFWREQLEGEINTLREIWANNELPPAEPRCFKTKDGYKECQYCNWRKKCEEIENETNNTMANS